jgi:hypothetical protein
MTEQIGIEANKTTEVGGAGGYDGGKRVKGRNRHIIVDTLGLLLMVVVTAANVDDGTRRDARGADASRHWAGLFSSIGGELSGCGGGFWAARSRASRRSRVRRSR